ncbi:MAG: pyruvate ferredoxin oxidoreductase [Chromatiales bacterium]|nr:pyruvate ferredoxin oxidoreductase [Chromatiales bacterium]
MLQALEGSQALAKAVALCRPQVVAAYPITPQTHIVENIAKLVADGEFRCELVSVESEFSAASVALGAAAAGSRAYTASASQGILLMSEVLFNIAGLRVPMVLTCANRAVSGPLSIWNDQQDSMAVRDSGWIQLYCGDNQEAVDTTIQAYRIAERTEVPVMVCVDGFVLTHTLEPIDMPEQSLVDQYLPPYAFSRALNPAQPISIGTLVSPDFFTEARHSHHAAMIKALAEIESADTDWQEVSGRGWGGLFEVQGPEDADTALLTLGSTAGTLADGLAQIPGGDRVKVIRLRCFRPFPVEALQRACAGLKRIGVIERALSPGQGGIVATELRDALEELDNPPKVHGFAAGLGGRDIPLTIAAEALRRMDSGEATRFAIIDVELDKLPPEDR